MISQQFDIAEFVDAVRGKSYSEIIILAELEDTIAERCRYRRGNRRAEEAICLQCSQQLKDLIFYLRYSAIPTGVRLQDLYLFQNLVDKKRKKAFQIPFRSTGHPLYYSPPSSPSN